MTHKVAVNPWDGTKAFIVDLSMTQVVDKDLVKILSRYGHEWDHANQMIREALEMLG